MNMTKSIKNFCAGFAIAIFVLAPSLHLEAAPPVQVSAADPSTAPQGTLSLDVTISGSGFDSSAAVDFFVTDTTNPGGITVKRVTFVGSKKLIATIDVADTAVVAQFDIQVRLSGGRKGKGTTLFAVQKAGSTEINPAFILDSQQSYKFKVVRLNADGNEAVTLTNPIPSDAQPRWSPDGKSILYFDRLSWLVVRIDSRSGAVQGAMPPELSDYAGFDWSNGNVDSCGSLIVYSVVRDPPEYDLVVIDPTFSNSKKLVTAHDLDDALTGNQGDPDTWLPVWSPNKRFIAANSCRPTSADSPVNKLIIYSISCSSGVDVSVDGETELTHSFGSHFLGGFSWNSSGRYLALTVHESTDANLWIADLGDPSQAGFPSSTPTFYRLTGANRPFGGGAERVVGTSFAPATDTIAFLTQGTKVDRDDSLYTINAGACIAAIAGTGSISTACAATLVSKGVNAHQVDWRPNWPTPLQQ